MEITENNPFSGLPPISSESSQSLPAKKSPSSPTEAGMAFPASSPLSSIDSASIDRVNDQLLSENEEDYKSYMEYARENPTKFAEDIKTLLTLLAIAKEDPGKKEASDGGHPMEGVMVEGVEKTDKTVEKAAKIVKQFTKGEKISLKCEAIGEGGSVLATLLLASELPHWKKSKETIEKLEIEIAGLNNQIAELETQKINSSPLSRVGIESQLVKLKSQRSKKARTLKKEQEILDGHVSVTAVKMFIQGITDTKETISLINSLCKFSPHAAHLLSTISGSIGIAGGTLSMALLTYLTKKNLDKRHTLKEKITHFEKKDANNIKGLENTDKAKKINKIFGKKISALNESKARNKRSILQNLSSYSVCTLSIVGGSLILAGVASGGIVTAAASAVALAILAYSVGVAAYDNRHQLHNMRERLGTRLQIKMLQAERWYNEKKLSSIQKKFDNQLELNEDQHKRLAKTNTRLEKANRALSLKIGALELRKKDMAKEVDDLGLVNKIGITGVDKSDQLAELEDLRNTIKDILEDDEARVGLMLTLAEEGVPLNLIIENPFEATIHFLTHHSE